MQWYLRYLMNGIGHVNRLFLAFAYVYQDLSTLVRVIGINRNVLLYRDYQNCQGGTWTDITN